MTTQDYLRIVRAAHQLDVARVQYQALLVGFGLDPSLSYRYDDATLEITPIERAPDVRQLTADK
jgi:hypothetical protein